MKITFSIITLCKGGAQRMLAELINQLIAKGHEVIILMPMYGIVEYDVKAPIVRISGNSPSASDFPASDFIVSNYYTTVAEAEAASNLGKGKHVRLCLCYEPTFLKENHISFKTYHMAKNLFVLSKWQQNIVYLNHGILGEIIPIGISSAFKPLNIRIPNDPIQISAIYRIPEGDYSWHREQDYLLQELFKVKYNLPSVKFNLISPPSEFYSSPSLKELKKLPWLNFYTPANDIELNYHLNQTDIFVSSSTYESASLPGLEAMKTGATLVTTYSGGNTDYCRHGHNCLMSYRYEGKLFQHIVEAIQNDELRIRIAKEGMIEASKWTWERSADLFENGLLKIQ